MAQRFLPNFVQLSLLVVEATSPCLAGIWCDCAQIWTERGVGALPESRLLKSSHLDYVRPVLVSKAPGSGDREVSWIQKQLDELDNA